MGTEGSRNSAVSVSTVLRLSHGRGESPAKAHGLRAEIQIYHGNGEKGKLESAPWSGLLKLWACMT